MIEKGDYFKYLPSDTGGISEKLKKLVNTIFVVSGMHRDVYHMTSYEDGVTYIFSNLKDFKKWEFNQKEGKQNTGSR